MQGDNGGSSGRDPLTVERFLLEAGQLHQTWIRRFDAQHRRRPRPLEIETERLRLVRRLQLVQRLQGENLSLNQMAERLAQLRANPRDARLVDDDDAFLDALQHTWEAAQVPQAATMTAGARPPQPSTTVEFRW